jgi:hypothetical protein
MGKRYKIRWTSCYYTHHHLIAHMLLNITLFSHLVYMYLCTLTFSRKIYNTPMNFYVAKLFRHHSEIRLWFWKNKHVVEKKFWTKIIWISVCECKNTCSWNWKTRVYQYICVLGYVKHPTVYIQTQWITWIWGIVDNTFDEIKVKCRTSKNQKKWIRIALSHINIPYWLGTCIWRG